MYAIIGLITSPLALIVITILTLLAFIEYLAEKDHR